MSPQTFPSPWLSATRSDGVVLPYRVEGQGRPLILVPGLGGSSRLFGTFPRTLARLGWRALVYDPPGLGLIQDYQGTWTFESAALDIRALMDAEGLERIRLLGTSLGGKISAWFMAQHPDLVEEAFFYGTEASGSARAIAVYDFWESVFRDLPEDRIFPSIRPFLFGAAFQAKSARLLDDLARSFSPGHNELRTTLQQVAALRTAPFPEILAQVTQPVVCHAGLEDSLVLPCDVEATSRALPAGRYQAVEAAGHSMLLENAEACLVALRLDPSAA
jgi:aminoacrylate hydrolase